MKENKRAQQKEQRKADILRAALDLFVCKGYGDTKIADIAEKANMSMGLLFHYFESKEQLYMELVKIGCKEIELKLEDIKETPIMYFERTAEDIFRMINENPVAARMFVFVANAQHSEAIPAESKELLSQMDIIKLMVPVIEKGQKSGEIRPGNPWALSVAFWGAIQGIAEEIALNPNTPCPEAKWIMSMLKSE